MALLDYVSLGGVELVNHLRLAAYLESVGSPLDSTSPCVCPTLNAGMFGDADYTTPAADEAPWYDPAVPESADFAGFMLLSIDGIDDYPVKRSVTNAIAGGGVIGPARALPLTLVFTGILLGATCCAVEYGLHWLKEALQGCAGQSCDGDCMEIFTCCPDEEDLDQDCFNDGYRRTLRRVALVDGPTPTERTGTGCTAGLCQNGADIITVEFTLVAATPWLWTDPVPLVEVTPPLDTSTDCVTWCIHGSASSSALCLDADADTACSPTAMRIQSTDGACVLAWPVSEDLECGGTCRFKPCTDTDAGCADPMCATPAPPTVGSLETCYCLPLAVERQCCDIDLSECPAWSVDVPVITVRAGSHELRNLTITMYERTPNFEDMDCEAVAEAQRCDAFAVFTIGYVPAGGALTLDGQIGRAIVECGGSCESSGDVYGADGGPLVFPTMNCASYIFCLETDVANPPADDSLVTISVSGRGL